MAMRSLWFANGCAIVTGGGSGIGRGIALALARRNMAVFLVGRRIQPLREVAAQIAACGGRAAFTASDIADPAARLHLLAAARTAFGPVHLLVNNAATLASGSLFQLNGAEIDHALATNLAAPIDLTRLVLPDLIHTEGAVIFLGSTASHLPLPSASLYAASKTGLHAFCTSLRYELAPLGVHLLEAFPPTVDTAMTDSMARNAGRWQGRRQHPEAAGEQIVAALAAGKNELQWGKAERLLLLLNRLAPRLLPRALATQRRRFAQVMTPSPASYDYAKDGPVASLSSQLETVRTTHPIQICQIEGHAWPLLDSHGAGAPLLLLPGALGEADTSFEYILALQDRWRVLSLNYPQTLPALSVLLEGVIGLLDHLDIDQTHVVGGSYSGSVAQYLASSHPERVTSLLLSNTGVPGHSPPWRWKVSAAALAPLPEPWLHGIMRTGTRWFLPAASPQHLFWRSYFEAALPLWSKQALVGRLRLMGDMEKAANVLRLHHSPFRGPVLVVEAAADRLVSARQRNSLRALYPQAQHASLITKGHVASLDEAGTFIHLYREFLCRQQMPNPG